MGDTSNFIEQGVVHAEKAIDFDRAACKTADPEKYSNAKNSYLRAVEYYNTAVKYEKNDRTKSALREAINNYVDRAEVMYEWLAKYQEAQSNLPSENPSGGGTAARKKEDKKDDDETGKLQSQLGSAILSEKPNVRWDDVAGLEGAKDALKEAVVLPQKFPHIFTGKRKPWKGILLYGPPGTGKSYLAKAVATEADAKFFSISSSDLVSKWQGESEKLVKELFTMARASGKAIIFIDEIDALVSTRGDSESESSRRIKTEFLVQMDGVGNTSSDGVLLLGATNIPWGLDDALLRRMERRVYIPLPSLSARTSMFKLHIGNTPQNLVEEDYEILARQSEGYSGADIGIVVRDAIMQPVRTLQNAQFFKKISIEEEGKTVQKYTPCSPGDPGKIEMNLMSIKSEELHVPEVCMRDFELALSNTKPSVGKDNVEKHVKFTSEKGQSGV